MYCNKCGKNLSAESKFCNFCGASLPTEKATTVMPRSASIHVPLAHEEKFPALQNNQEERVIFQIRPSFYNVGLAYAGAAIFALLAMAIFGFFKLSLGIAMLLALAAFIFPLFRHYQRNRIVYTLTPSKIEIDSGIFAKTVRNIPLRNAQDVTVSATLIERIIGVGDVIIDSASETGKIRMRQIPNPRKHADLILQQL